MTGYSFQEGVPSGFAADFDSGIFHDPRHLQLQSTHGWYSFAMTNDAAKTIVALLHLYVEKQTAVSSLRAPYGSVLISKKLNADLLEKFFAFLESKLKDRGVKNIILKNPPEVYLPKETKVLTDVLATLGYERSQETSAVIPITPATFESIIHHSAKKRLRKCHEAGFIFNQLPLQNLATVYQYLKTWRDQKEYTLSMSLEELMKVIDIFPDVFFLTTVTHGGKPIAANISIQVNRRVLYNFYHDHDANYDVYSPVVLLNEGLYKLCQNRNLELLDLGTSQRDGKLNESLFNFKLKLGGLPSDKVTFVKNFA